jgi:hypothetical protein
LVDDCDVWAEADDDDAGAAFWSLILDVDDDDDAIKSTSIFEVLVEAEV